MRKGSKATELMTDATSAFRAGLAVDDDGIYLLTDEVAYRLVPGTQTTRIPLANGGSAAVTRDDFVYWSKGGIWRAPKFGGKAQRVASLKQEPQYFVAAARDFAWVTMQDRDRFLIQTLAGPKVKTLVAFEGRIETATMDAGRVYFVAHDDTATWRIGSVSIHGGAPTYTAPKAGQTPAKLAAAGNVYYYDVESSELRELSNDLTRERTLTHDLICSPLAVSVRIYCPNVEGMFELARHRGAKIMPLFPSPARITAVAAGLKYLVWLNDAGPDRLSLKMIPLELDDVP